MQNFSYTYNDICHSLVEVGLDKGDIAYFSTSLGMIGQCNEAMVRPVPSGRRKHGKRSCDLP